MSAIGILGAGSWGTALAISWARMGLSVFLRPRTAEQAERLSRERSNEQYLPGFVFPKPLKIWSESHPPTIWQSLDACVIATPASVVLPLVETLLNDWSYPKELPLVIASKGFDPQSGELLPRMIEKRWPEGSIFVLSGPSFAIEVAENRPTALVLAGRSDVQTQQLVSVLHHPRLRIYRNRDPMGVAWAGAHKNVLAIAAGIADALKLGSNARAALITRGLAEMRRLGLAKGARDETFLGLAGIGDLMLTATDPLSRNFRLGRFLGQGLGVDESVEKIGQVVEGRWSVLHANRFAEQYHLSAPLTDVVFKIIEEGLSPEAALEQLLLRQNGLEFG